MMSLNKIFFLNIFFVSIYWGINCDVCCNNRDFLLNVSHPDSSILYQAFTTTFHNGIKPSYPFKLKRRQQLEVTFFIQTDWFPIISDNSITLTHKHAIISRRTINYVTNNVKDMNASFLECVFIPEFGYFGHYLKCFFGTEFEHKDIKLDCGKHFTPTPYWLTRAPGCSPSYCCKTRDSLLNQEEPTESEIIRMFTETFERRNMHYKFNMHPKRKAVIRTLLTNWTTVISNKELTNEQKHQQIYDSAIALINKKYAHEPNKSILFCINTDKWGPFGSYLACQVKVGSAKPPYPLECEKYFEYTPKWFLPEIPCKPEPITNQCCATRDSVLNQAKPINSLLITSLTNALNIRYYNKNHPLFTTRANRIKLGALKTEWIKIIGNTDSNSEKHKKIYDASKTVLESLGGTNKSFYYCIPLEGYSTIGNYEACENPNAINVTCNTWFNTKQDWIEPTVPCKESEQNTYCCHNRHFLLNKYNPNDSVLVQTFYKAFEKHEGDEFDPVFWDEFEKDEWTFMMTNEWLPIIGNKTITNTQKLQMIYDSTVTYIEYTFGTNKSVPLCTYFEGYGSLAHVLKCDVDFGIKNAPPFELSCNHWFDVKPFWARPPLPCLTTTPRIVRRETECCSPITNLTQTNATIIPPSNYCIAELTYTCESINKEHKIQFSFDRGAYYNNKINLFCKNKTIQFLHRRQYSIVNSLSCAAIPTNNLTTTPAPTNLTSNVTTTKALECCSPIANLTGKNATIIPPSNYCIDELTYTCESIDKEGKTLIEFGRNSIVTNKINFLCKNKTIQYLQRRQYSIVNSLSCTGTPKQST